jgi:hypothetical protein
MTTTQPPDRVYTIESDELVAIIERSNMAVGTAERGVYVMTDAESDRAELIEILKVLSKAIVNNASAEESQE